MADLRRYWQEIRTLQQSLPEFPWVMSIEDLIGRCVGGVLAEVTAEVAARLLHARSHRLATEDEIQRNREAGEAQNRAAERLDLERKGVVVVRIPPGK